MHNKIKANRSIYQKPKSIQLTKISKTKARSVPHHNISSHNIHMSISSQNFITIYPNEGAFGRDFPPYFSAQQGSPWRRLLPDFAA